MAKGNASTAALIARAETRLRQLCGLGFGGLVAAPTLLGELRKAVPGSSAVIFYQRPGERVGIYQESLGTGALMSRPDVRKVLDADDEGTQGKTLFQPFHEFMHEPGVRDIRVPSRSPQDDMRESELRAQVLTPAEQQSIVRLQVRDGSGYIGMVGVGRSAHDARGGRSEIESLRQLEPFLKQALTPRGTPAFTEVENGHSAMLLVDAKGSCRGSTPGMRALLALALGAVDAALPAAALRWVQTLFARKRGVPPPPRLSWRCRSRWGGFEFRANRLDCDTTDVPLAVVTITRLVPLPLRLFEALGEFDMAPRQSEVALGMALGNTQDQVARDLGLSRATVIYHRRQIYNQLGVDTREQLLDRLLCPSTRSAHTSVFDPDAHAAC